MGKTALGCKYKGEIAVMQLPLKYCVWSSQFSQDIAKPDKVQRWETKMLQWLEDMTSEVHYSSVWTPTSAGLSSLLCNLHATHPDGCFGWKLFVNKSIILAPWKGLVECMLTIGVLILSEGSLFFPPYMGTLQLLAQIDPLPTQYSPQETLEELKAFIELGRY